LVLATALVIFSALFWLVLTRNLTCAIGEMTRATEAIAEGQFDIRAPGARRDELGRLGAAINRMAARLKGFITGQRRFLGDAAHEFCSPLARMEVTLGILEAQRDGQADPYLRDMREELTHMRKLAHELLSFTKASLGEGHVRLEPVSVPDVARAAVEQEGAEASVQVDVPGDLRVRAHRELLLRALANLVRNALRYAADDGPITITAHPDGEHVIISVADGGPGVPPAEIERLFDPFYRLDESRTSETGGTGLGLAIVKTCIEACDGSVSARNRMPHGLDVQIRCQAARSNER
jgi:two-component system sensor histidine kinase CpxA